MDELKKSRHESIRLADKLSAAQSEIRSLEASLHDTQIQSSLKDIQLQELEMHLKEERHKRRSAITLVRRTLAHNDIITQALADLGGEATECTPTSAAINSIIRPSHGSA